ncbi:MAG: chitobiase/beta-hexosaminidase C-terminal domain-containing protein, partial [Oscillospiraceae bacterium]|nr:chitobiase/beta-hexosaminidase C-terminal domain-containing protein [Oscillospiraceae bacterium]
EGTKVNISAHPGQNYHFKEWQVISGGVTLKSTTDANTYFEMGSENVEIRAVFEKDIFVPDKPTPEIKAVFGGRTVMLTCENDLEADIYYQFGSSNITSSCAHIKSGETIFIDTPKTGKDAALYFKAYNGKWSALGKWGVLNVQIAKPLITQSGKKAENKFKIYTQTKDSYIVYTLNGTVPSIEEGVQKLKVKNGRLVWGTSAVIEVPKGRTVKAIAIRSGLVTSDVMTFTNS